MIDRLALGGGGWLAGESYAAIMIVFNSHLINEFTLNFEQLTRDKFLRLITFCLVIYSNIQRVSQARLQTPSSLAFGQQHSCDMPLRTRKQLSKAQQARRYLTHGGVARDDSDDELGLEDHPWIWIFETEDGYESDEDAPSEGETTDDGPLKSRKRKRKSHRQKTKGDIVGAKMGSFECRVGECVLLKAEGSKEAYVGLICEFCEDEDGDKAANFMWFSSEKEIVNNSKKRKDFMEVWFLLYIKGNGTMSRAWLIGL